VADERLQEGLDRLYGAPLEDFIAERTRLAKELRGDGERETAEEVGKLAKPTAGAWALNHVAREEPDAVEEWLDAARALREASEAPAQGDELREAIAAHRDATVRLTNLVRDRAQPSGKPLSGAMVERVRALLRGATSDEGAFERLRAGRVTEEPAAAELSLAAPAGTSPRRAKASPAGDAKAASSERGPKAGAAPGGKAGSAGGAKAGSAGGVKAGKRERAAEARAARRAELGRRIEAARAEAERLRAQSDAHAAQAAAADERLEEAHRSVRRAESEAAAARQAAKDADHAAGAAERDLRRLEGLVRRAGD
jgi:hypothetical protein